VVESRSGVSEIAGEVERYLEAHPEASDTAAGIAQWWLTRARFGDDPDVLPALELLIERGIVERLPLMGGTTLFRRARCRAPT
jgi:hypothetical protein